MTISSEKSRSGPYRGNGTTTAFDYKFRIVNKGHVKVIRTEVSGLETTLLIDTDYTVSGVGDPAGGQVIVNAAPDNGQSITILRNVPLTQETDLENQGAYYAETVEAAFDLATMRDQQLQEQIDRAVKLPPSSGGSQEPLVDAIYRLSRSADSIDVVAGDILDINAVAENIDAIKAVSDVADDLAETAAEVAENAIIAGQAAAEAQQQISGSTPTVVRFSGDDVEDEFDTGTGVDDEKLTQIYIDGVYQQKDTYTVSEGVITFSDAPPTGVDNIEVVVSATSAQAFAIPSNGTVTPSKIGNGLFLNASSAASVSLISVSSDVSTIVTSGRSFAGDGGGASYRRALSEPEHSGKIQTLDGAWWELVAQNGEVGCSAFGALSGDVSEGLQAAIDFTMYGASGLNSKGASALIDAQSGNVSKTIHLGYGTTYKGGILRGMGKAYRGTLGMVGTTLISSVSDAPTLSIQGARHSLIEGLTILGPAVDAIVGLDASNPREITSEAAWNDALSSSGVTPGRRYAPHAGIAIDPYAGVRPGTSYPDVDYPDWLGGTAQYGKNYSSAVDVERVIISGFEVAFAVQPSNVTGNGDFIRLKNALVERCKYGMSVGNDQGRDTDLSETQFNRVYTVMTNNTHGKQLGKFGTSISNLHGAGFIYQLFDFNRAVYAGPLTFTSAYFESIVRLGRFTETASQSSPLNFIGCHFKFYEWTANGGACPPAVIEGDANDTLNFDGTLFRTSHRIIAMPRVKNVILQNGTNNEASDVPAKPYEAMAMNALMNGFVLDPMSKKGQKASMRPWNVSSMASSPVTACDESFSFTSRTHGVPHYLTAGACSVAGEWSHKRVYAGVLAANQRSSVLRTGRTVTFINNRIASNPTAPDLTYTENMMPGCVIVHRDSGTTMFIRSVNPTTGETAAELQNNFVGTPSGFELWDTDWSPADGVWYLISGLVFCPPRMLWGKLTAGSNKITSIRSAGGTDETDYGLQVGDRLAGSLYQDTPFAGSSALSITAIDTTLKEITLAGTSRISDDYYPLPWWYRQAPANEASR